MKRKFIFRTLICLLALAMLLTACDNNTPGGTTTGDAPSGTTTAPIVDTTAPVNPNPPVKEDGFLVTFKDTAAASIESNLELGKRIDAGTVISFTVKISDLYQGTPVVRAGEQELTANEQGMYSFTVEADTVITIEGLTLKSSEMEGEGTSDDPFLVTSPLDMLYIAEQVNKGNTTYVAGFYKLQNDLDFKGMEMSIIGDGSTDAAVFAGYFDGNGHTISNYRIVSSSTQYVGLFGVLQADMTGSGGGSIYNLHLKDFTVECDAAGMGCFVGSMVGYGMGGNLVLCSAQGGQINVYADNNSFSYVGGLVGIQQAMDYNSYAFYSSVSYCNSDVQINCNSGLVYAAGGIAGYVAASSGGVVASLNNCYAVGDVYGAMRSGGLVGYLDSGASVINSYATGVIAAQSSSTDTVNSEDFCFAYAGGLVGYAEADSVIAECFSTAQMQAIAAMGAEYQVTSGLLAYAAEPTEFDYGLNRATVYNCIYAKDGKDGDIDLTKGEYIKEKLSWNPLDWKFEDGKYPVVNTEDNEEFFFEIKINIEGKEYTFERDVYMTMQFWYQYVEGALPSRLIAEDGSTRISYGYFFDKEFTMPVPESFIPSHNITLYAAVADVAEVAGEYDFVVEGAAKPIRLTLNTNGTFTYEDAGTIAMSGYIYDGKNILFEDCRFGRCFDGNVELTHYQTYDFYATVMEDGRLEIVGGVYKDTENYNQDTAIFKADAPLVALPLRNALSGSYAAGNGVYTFYADGTALYEGINGLEELTYIRDGQSLQLIFDEKTYTGTVTADGITVDGTVLKQLDAFSGSWNVDSKANKVYTFDGAGNWSYSYYGYKTSGVKTVYDRASGTYTIENGVMTLSGDFSGTAQLKDGALIVTIGSKSVSCHRDGSFYGTWVYPDYGMTLYLNGITAEGQGTARIEYLYENGTIEAYNLVYALDEKYADRVCLYYENDIFGFLTYVPGSNLMHATIYVGSMGTFMSNVNMGGVDDFEGQWIGDIEGMATLEFNGYGSYTIGSLIIDGKEIAYRLDDATLEGTFTYNGVAYTIAYHEEDDTITLTYGDKTATYCRKDAFADVTLTDGNGNFYTFDGRDSLAGQGTMYVNGKAEYTYTISNGELVIYKDGGQVGDISIADTEYVLNLPNTASTNLRIQHAFTGTWAMSGSPEANLIIGTMDLEGKLTGNVNKKDVVFTLEDDGALSFTFPGNSTVFYFIPVGDDAVIDSDKEWYLYGEQIECARIDEMYGTWKNSLGAAYQFDGMSNGSLVAALAQAGHIGTEGFVGSTAYGYAFNEELGQYILWTTSSTTGETLIYRLNFCDISTRRAFINEDGTKAFTVEEGDRLYNMEVKDEETDITYQFDGFGTVTTSDGKTYTYKLANAIDYEKGIAIANITIDGETWQATIDFSDSTNPTITLEKK